MDGIKNIPAQFTVNFLITYFPINGPKNANSFWHIHNILLQCKNFHTKKNNNKLGSII